MVCVHCMPVHLVTMILSSFNNSVGAKEKTKLLENKITHILSVHDNAKPLYPDVSCIIMDVLST